MSEIFSVRVNWHQHPEYGEQFEEYTVGRDYPFEEDNITRRCIGITEVSKNGQHVEIKFEDGVMLEKWNINEIKRYEARAISNPPEEYYGDQEIELLSE